ncbi:MAG: helix-turn-helix domain-containing protein [Thermoplasmata archaeon]
MQENGKDDELTQIIKNFKNRTKLSVITLLIKGDPMTVTQLSKKIKTTRSNLYQVMKDLLRDNIIVQSGIKAEKNYVEKYYMLNVDLFEKIKNKDLMNTISKMNDSDMKELLISVLTTNSMMLNILAEDLKMATDTEFQKYRHEFENDSLIMSFSSVSSEVMKKFSRIYYNFVEDLENTTETEPEDHLLFIIGFPSIRKENVESKPS